MKYTLPPLIASIALCAPAFADVAPFPKDDEEVRFYIACLEDPDSSSDDIYRCVGWLQEMAERGQKLARRYITSESISTKRSLESKNTFIQKMKKRCDEGDFAGCANLGLMYQEGYYAPKDMSKALIYQGDLVEMGGEAFAPDVIHAYMNGKGVPKDLNKAAYYYQKYLELSTIEQLEDEEMREACNIGVALGCYLLGEKNFNQQPYEEARTYYQKAADLGHRPSIELLKLLDPFQKADQKPAEEKASGQKPAETTKTPETETPVTP